MTLAELREQPNMITTGGSNQHRIHESCFRSYGMLGKVRELLMSQEPVPPKVILEMIEDVMDAPSVTKDMRSPS